MPTIWELVPESCGPTSLPGSWGIEEVFEIFLPLILGQVQQHTIPTIHSADTVWLSRTFSKLSGWRSLWSHQILPTPRSFALATAALCLVWSMLPQMGGLQLLLTGESARCSQETLSGVKVEERERELLLKRLVTEPLLYTEVRATISTWNFSTSCTSSGSFYIPRATFCSWGSNHQGYCLWLPRNTMHLTPLAPPTGGESTGVGPHVASSGCVQPDPIGKGPVARCFVTCPAPSPGSRKGPRNPHPGKRKLGTIYVNYHNCSSGLLLVSYLGPVCPTTGRQLSS